jgi:hypothetical protein
MTARRDADELIRRLCRAGISLQARDDRIVWSAPPAAMTPELLGELVAAKPDVLASLRRSAQGWLPLAPAQAHLYVQERLAPGRAGLNIPAAVRFRGQVDETALRRALNTLVRRHDALRMIFDIQGATPMQRACPASDVPLAIRRAVDQDEALRMLDDDARRPFDLTVGPALRALVVEYGSSRSLIQLTFHHLSCDEYSLRLALGEVLFLYAEDALGHPAGVPDSPRSYESYATAGSAGTRELHADLRYWRERLADLPPPAPPAEGPPYLAVIDAGADAVGALHALAREERTTLAGAVLTVFILALRGTLDRNDVMVGMPFNGRSPEYATTVGTFVNTFVLRSRAPGATTFRELLRATRLDLLEALDHTYLPYHAVVNAVRRGGRWTELFDAWMVIREVQSMISIPGLHLTPVDAARAVATHSLKLDLEFGREGLRGFLLGRSPTWKPATVDRLAAEISTAFMIVSDVADEALTAASAAIQRAADQILDRRRNDVARSVRSRIKVVSRSRR